MLAQFLAFLGSLFNLLIDTIYKIGVSLIVLLLGVILLWTVLTVLIIWLLT